MVYTNISPNLKEDRSESSRFKILKSIFNFSQNEKFKGVQTFDDAAIIQHTKEVSLVIASDFVRGSGFSMFRNGLMNFKDIGYYLIVANISDIAAMGCKPTGLTNVFRYKNDISNEEFQQVLEGMKEACLDYDTQIVGGDIGSYQENVLTATAFGFMDSKKALLRSSAKKGDMLCLVGSIGLPFTALLYFEKAKNEGLQLSDIEEQILINSWCRPTAQVECGFMLSSNQLANACQDVSDGLKASIEQISCASNVFFKLFENKLPINDITIKVAKFLNVSPTAVALSASVDFSLLFTVEKEKIDKTQILCKKNNIELFVIGATSESNYNCLVSENQNETEIPGLKWDHKSGSVIEQFFS